MKTSTGRYPWATRDATTCLSQRAAISSMNATDVCHRRALSAWAHAGAPGLENFFPGPSYVDYVGVSLYARSGRPSSTPRTTDCTLQGERASNSKKSRLARYIAA